MGKSICLYCGSRVSTNGRFSELAQKTGMEVAQRNWKMVFGGGKVGLMGKAADAALKLNGEVIGVIPTNLKELEVAHLGLTELHETQDMHTRKALMESLSDAFLVLPGGFGTLDEFFEILTWRQLGIHNKPIILMNVDGYFNGLIQFTENAIRHDFIKENNRSLFNICSDIDSCFALLEQHFENS